MMYGITQPECKSIALRDGHLVSTDPSKYAKANEDRYYVLCNTWLLMCYDLAGSVANRVLLNSIKTDGLLATIDTCSKIASEAIKSGFTYTPDSALRALFTESEKDTLQLLRYPKRFSPSLADKIAKSSIDAFIKVNNQCKGAPSVITPEGRIIKRKKEYPQWLLESVREYVGLLLTIPCENYEDKGLFSNGATADGCHTLLEKVKAFAAHSPNYLGVLYPLGASQEEDTTDIKVVTVPKSYKAARVIAECSAYKQFHLQGIRRCAEEAIARSVYSDLIVLDDQSINQEWSRLGSVYGTFATLDLSSASDSIADSLAEQLLPRSWYDAVNTWNTAFIKVDNKRIRRYTFQTSGNGSTFVLESVIFLSIALAATEYAAVLTGLPLREPRTFGDDLIVDVRAYGTVCDFLELLGFTVNLDKSFGCDSFYRESCGAEWYCGLDMATKYYPRTSLEEDSPEYLESLISLQHRIFSYASAEDWLTRHIRAIGPKYGAKEITSSDPGTDCGDLWEHFPFFKKMLPPYDHSRCAEAPESIRREAHTTLRSRLPKGYHAPSAEELSMLEMVLYVDFLRHGPSYDEFGVYLPRPSIDQYCSELEQYFTIVKR